MIGEIVANMADPHGWWWLVDLVVFGTAGTLGIAFANAAD